MWMMRGYEGGIVVGLYIKDLLESTEQGGWMKPESGRGRVLGAGSCNGGVLGVTRIRQGHRYRYVLLAFPIIRACRASGTSAGYQYKHQGF